MLQLQVITITTAFQKILDESNCKPNNRWVDKGSKFYNRSITSWLQDIEMYSAVRISKYKNIFTKGYTPNWSGEVSVIKKK